MDNHEQERAKALKSYFDDVSEQYEKGNTINEVEAVERMRVIREKIKNSDDFGKGNG
ncbi:hypothetical protein [Vogesella indigofera]|uniref:Uncharacterized protein n=1 Tax=Vogesella indigofera TaxID=45465 RepID=A0ABT5I8L9_VOGIN|nr:hypothetical protein [Vogesella indigofera]MDC7692468.1 hypothetical protein [Vogesella indigofera]